MLTDFQGFTRLAGNLSPEKLVESVDYYFSKFDQIIEKYHLEKIKTIGDAYIFAGCLHFRKKDNDIKILFADFEIADFVGDCKKKGSKN